METKIYFRSLAWFAFLLLLVVSACVSDDIENRRIEKNEATITFSVTLPGASTSVTRALGETEENEIRSIEVLVFDGVTFRYAAHANTITSGMSVNTKTFTVKLLQGTFDLFVLANAGDFVSSLTAGITKADIINSFTLVRAGKWNADPTVTGYIPIPMWGEINGVTIAEGTNTEVKLTRMLAKVDVKVMDGAKAVFSLASVDVFNFNTAGSLIPQAMLWDAVELKATAPHIPASSTFTQGPLRYVGSEITTPGSDCEGEIYLFEAQAGASTTLPSNTCLVVGGTYNGETHYYRVDFIDASSNFLPLLRNHKYTVRVKAVNGPGLPTSEEAFRSRPVNMVAEVLLWNDGDMGEVVFDGQYMLAISQKTFEFARDAKTGELFIETDYDVAPHAGWTATVNDSWLTITGITPADKGTVGADGSTATGNHHQKIRLTFTVTENTTGQARETNLNITAGRLTQVVTVHQSMELDIELDILSLATGRPVTELMFASKAGLLPEPQSFDVKWSPPASSPLVNVTPIGSSAFTFNTDYDAITSASLPGGTGEKSYTIQPNAIDPAEWQSNPFRENVSKVDFTVYNGENFFSKSLILRQMVYHLESSTEAYYPLDGEEQTFSVRANYPWRAELIDNGNGAVSNLLTTAGSPNTSAGTTLSFLTTNDLANPSIIMGTAKVRFYHATDASIYNDVELFCTTGIIQGESNAYLVKPGNKMGILIPVSRANAGGTTRIGASDAFTAYLVWTDHPGGVKAVSGQSSAPINRITTTGSGNSGYILVLPGAVEGNSVVSVKVGGTIRWSWHIWTTNYDPELPSGQKALFAGTTVSMDRHLGAYAADLTGLTGYWQTGLFYQWGRKDPFIGAAGWTGGTRKTIYNASGSTASFSNNPSTLANTIQNPGAYATAHTGSNGNTSWDNGGKTVYDPCPVGWKVPLNGAWSGLTTVNFPYSATPRPNRNNSSVGLYPLPGYLQDGSGALLGVGGSGHAWSASPNSTNTYYLYFTTDNMRTSESNTRGFGLPVRCVKE